MENNTVTKLLSKNPATGKKSTKKNSYIKNVTLISTVIKHLAAESSR